MVDATSDRGDDTLTLYSLADEVEIHTHNGQREAHATRLSPSKDLSAQSTQEPAPVPEPQRPERDTADTPAEAPSGTDTRQRTPHLMARALKLGRRPVPPSVIGLAALVIMLLAFLPGEPTGGLAARVVRPQATATATATPQPTATPTASLSATPMPGFKLFTDPSGSFQIQYPATWISSQRDTAVNFSNDPLSYQVQVGQPGDPNLCSGADVASTSACWVDYVLGQEQQRWGDQFQRLNGPIPSATIGGQTWQSGVAVIGVQSSGSPGLTGQSGIRFQVYATLWSGKPYIIALSATDNAFLAGNDLYFKPMLSSFHFLPSAG